MADIDRLHSLRATSIGECGSALAMLTMELEDYTKDFSSHRLTMMQVNADRIHNLVRDLLNLSIVERELFDDGFAALGMDGHDASVYEAEHKADTMAHLAPRDEGL